MEFYYSLLISDKSCVSFNSQRDGILRFFLGFVMLFRLVSIPNGMEFYIRIFGDSMEPFVFQFPTGWNSTFIRTSPGPGRTVFQFPTGWNSTKTHDTAGEVLDASFNSQRDGILPILSYWISIDLSPFQFPTGWNSTIDLGIYPLPQKEVSIPNGMEFYRSGDPKSPFRCRFQFPTGWNSTVLSALYLPLGIGFNSQRDGILRLLHPIKNKARIRFNSQRDGILLIHLKGSEMLKLFQFPTGWNSTHNGMLDSYRTFVSIPNGMEFYDRQRNQKLRW